MTNLSCSVSNCANYNDEYCCRPSIEVTGKCACDCEQTCCNSFVEKGSGPQNSCCNAPNETVDISCLAENCVHNSDGKCHCEHVEMKGCSSGCTTCKGETECASFRAE